MRTLGILAHRWVGLAIAAFLFVAGVTGAVISWDHELDEWLNPHLTRVSSRGDPLPPLSFIERLERADARARASYVPLHAETGHSISMFVSPRVDPATRKPYELGYNQVFYDPITGRELGRREWGEPAVDREHLVPFLYMLHYSLHVPELWGEDHWGLWLMGGVALLWMIDCFVGLYLTLPSRVRPREPAAVRRQMAAGWWSRWTPAWRIKLGARLPRVIFDVHRAFGLWFWILLLILAISGASLNLYEEVAQPVVALVSSFTPTPFDLRTERPKHQPIEPGLSFAQALALARAEAGRRGWPEPAGSISYAERHGFYGVSFFEPGDDHGAAGVGPKELYLDGLDGQVPGDRIPWRGTPGDLFLQVQFLLHSGRIAGTPGRMISAMGVVVAALSVTGVVVWYRKWRGRRRRSQSNPPQPATTAPASHLP